MGSGKGCHIDSFLNSVGDWWRMVLVSWWNHLPGWWKDFTLDEVSQKQTLQWELCVQVVYWWRTPYAKSKKKQVFIYSHLLVTGYWGPTTVGLLWWRQRELKAAPQEDLNVQAEKGSNSQSPLFKVLWNKYQKGTHGDQGGALTLTVTNFAEARMGTRVNGTEERIHYEDHDFNENLV